METLIFEPVIRTYIEPIRTKNSLINTAYIKLTGINGDNQNNKIINTILSVKGSRIMPNLETKLNLRATIPSNESDTPITAIKAIKKYELKLSGS